MRQIWATIMMALAMAVTAGADELDVQGRAARIAQLEALMQLQAEFDQPVSFNMENRYETPSEQAYLMHYKSSDGWQYQQPSATEITDEQRAFVENVVLTEHPEEVTASLSVADIEAARKGDIRETDGEVIFSFIAPPGALKNQAEPLDVGDALRMEIAISADGERFVWMRIKNEHSFKANSVLKVENFYTFAKYVRPEGFNVDVLARQENYIYGKAYFFKKIEEKWFNRYSDYRLTNVK